MNRRTKYLLITTVAIATVGTVTVSGVYAAAQRVIDRRYDQPLMTQLQIANDAELSVKGRHLAAIYGCLDCHGKQLQGTELYDDAKIAKINAPNLTYSRKMYSDAQMERVIRHGVKRDGTSTWIMPAQQFSHMNDEELSALISFVRSVPEQNGAADHFDIRLVGRLGILLGKFKPVVEEIDASTNDVVNERSDPLKYGKYLVMNACTECHGVNLHGSEFLHAPSLLSVASYDDEAFNKLMRTGVTISGRQTGMMSEASKVRFSAFTDEELSAVRTYLRKWVAGGS